MNSLRLIIGKALYALVFLAILPTSLWLWSQHTGHINLYPAVESTFWGSIISAIGGILMLWGMFALWRYGNGLPMNAYPPEKFVSRGPYSIVRHPIYWGFGILLIGCSILTGSAAGLWLIVPVTILSMIALVLGYEDLDLARRFPGATLKTYFEIPRSDPASASLRDREVALVLVLTMMFLSNYIVFFLVGEVPALWGSSWNVQMDFSKFRLTYLSILFVAFVPFVLKTQMEVRKWTVSLIIALTLSIYISLLWPEVGAQYFSADSTNLNYAVTLTIALERVPIFLILLSLKAYVVRFGRISVLFYVIAIALSANEIVSSKSSLLHLLVGVSIFVIAANYFHIWIWLKGVAEKVANSWKEWTVGSIRIINHGIYAGVGAFCGILLAGWLTGKTYAWAILIFALVVIVFSALWAQIVEGSEKLKRPFGFYGALVGIAFASLVVWGMGYQVWIIVGAVSVVMPWVQAVGRFRCLINGCCHGSPTKNEIIGIRYFHYRSRVCGISGLKGELLHPTQLYSMLWLLFVGFVLLGFWISGLPNSFIFGLYLILTGIGRFVEEAFRGEIQTPVWNGLHLYQWTAILSLLIGIIMTMVPTTTVTLDPEFGWEILIAAFLGGFFTFFVMGVDFPQSKARFSRLV